MTLEDNDEVHVIQTKKKKKKERKKNYNKVKDSKNIQMYLL